MLTLMCQIDFYCNTHFFRICQFITITHFKEIISAMEYCVPLIKTMKNYFYPQNACLYTAFEIIIFDPKNIYDPLSQYG